MAEVFERQVRVNGKDYSIRILQQKESEDPFYFALKDVLNILGYKDEKSALQIIQDFKRGPCNIERAYINKDDISSLIKKSNASVTKSFKDIFFNKFLPSLYVNGTDNVTSGKNFGLNLNEMNKKLAKNSSINDDKTEWIYIATTIGLAKRRIFKVGSTKSIENRIYGYNVGRPKDDEYYYTWAKPCYKSMDLDYHIQKMLARFKCDGRKELYQGLNHSELVMFVEMLMDNYGGVIDRLEKIVRNRDRSLSIGEAVPPPRLDVKALQRRYYSQSTGVLKACESEDKNINIELYKFLKLKANCCGVSPGVVDIYRKDILDWLIERIDNYNRRGLWAKIKYILNWKDGKTIMQYGSLHYRIIY